MKSILDEVKKALNELNNKETAEKHKIPVLVEARKQTAALIILQD